MSPIDSGMGIFSAQFGVTAWGGGALLKEDHLQVRLEGSEPLAILELGKQEPQLHSERLSQKTKRRKLSTDSSTFLTPGMRKMKPGDDSD